jgi:hypothetical protein
MHEQRNLGYTSLGGNATRAAPHISRYPTEQYRNHTVGVSWLSTARWTMTAMVL